MDKQKQIEEMAKVVQRNMCGDKPCEECNYHGFKTKILPRYCEVYLIAEKLFNAGYRKIPDGAVVLTREEYDELCCSVGISREEVDRVVDLVEKDTRKETAEKFAGSLKGLFPIDEVMLHLLPHEQLHKAIDEICKELSEGK